MEREKRDSQGSGGGERADRIFHDTSGSGPSRRERDELEEELDKIIENWNLYKNTFLTKSGDHSFVLKLFSVAYSEEPHYEVIRQHADRISLVGLYGKAESSSRERLLGYILLYVGTPTIHMHTWFVGIAYSDKDDIRRKDPVPIAIDDNIRLWKAGIGVSDYHFVNKAKTREHDEAGLSDSATHLQTAGAWKDGIS